MTRATLTDDVYEVLLKVAEGNPGAVNVCASILKYGSEIDPQVGHPMLHVLALDDLGIYGSEIWMLYKDVCGSNLAHTLGVLRAHQLGFISADQLRHAIRNYGDGLDLPKLMESVSGELADFRADWAQPDESA